MQGGDGIFRIVPSAALINKGSPQKSLLLSFFGFGPSYQISRKLARKSKATDVTQIHIIDIAALVGLICIGYFAATGNYSQHIAKYLSPVKTTVKATVTTKVAALATFTSSKSEKQNIDLYSFPGWMTPGPAIPRPYPTPLKAFDAASKPTEIFNTSITPSNSAGKLDSNKDASKQANVELKKNVSTEEAVTVDLGTGKDITASKPVEIRLPSIAETESWVAVTTNDGQLVMRKQGAFKQIAIKERLPNGEILISLNEALGEYRTSNGKYQIKGSPL